MEYDQFQAAGKALEKKLAGMLETFAPPNAEAQLMALNREILTIEKVEMEFSDNKKELRDLAKQKRLKLDSLYPEKQFFKPGGCRSGSRKLYRANLG